MKRRQSIIRLASLLIAVPFATVNVIPSQAHAQSPRNLTPSQLAWVVDDATAQAHCTVNGLPCPVGEVQVLTVYTIPLMAAQAQHRPYIRADMSPSEQARFVQDVARQLPTAPRVHVSFQVQPSCQGNWTTITNQPRNYSLSINGATIQDTFTYDYNPCYLGGPAKAADHVAIAQVGGRAVYKSNASQVWDNGNVVDHDQESASTCASLPHTSSYGRFPFPANDSAYFDMKFSSGSNCTIFDTYSWVNYAF